MFFICDFLFENKTKVYRTGMVSFFVGKKSVSSIKLQHLKRVTRVLN